MPTFYVTTADNMPHGAGYWEVHAQTEAQARALAFTHCPDGRWSFIYPTLGAVHPLDRKRHGVIGATQETGVDSLVEPLLVELREFVAEHIAPPKIPLRDRLSASMRAIHQCQAEAPGFEPESTRTLVCELLAEDPDVHGPAMVELQARPVCAAWCRECGFTFAKVPIIAVCTRCNGTYLAKGTT